MPNDDSMKPTEDINKGPMRGIRTVINTIQLVASGANAISPKKIQGAVVPRDNIPDRNGSYPRLN